MKMTTKQTTAACGDPVPLGGKAAAGGRRALLLSAPLWLAGCVSYGGGGLRPGMANLDEVLAAMGPPARQWQAADGTRTLSYPRGPSGLHSFMVYIDANGKFVRSENVLDENGFARVKAEMTEDEVERAIGPSIPALTTHYPARKEIAWEWRYCNAQSATARFYVLFDADTRRVRSSMRGDETCVFGACACSN